MPVGIPRAEGESRSDAALSEDCALEGEAVAKGKGGATVQILLPVVQGLCVSHQIMVQFFPS